MKMRGLGKDMSKPLRKAAQKHLPEFGISDGVKTPTPKVPMPKIKMAKGGSVSDAKQDKTMISRHNRLMHAGQVSKLRSGGKAKRGC